MTLNHLINQTMVNLANAQDELVRAAQRTSDARRDETDCTNRVNELQKEFDKLVTQVKGQAPRGTDWKRPPSQPAE